MSSKINLVVAVALAALGITFAAQAADEKPATEGVTVEKAAPKTKKKAKPHDHSQFHKSSAPAPDKADVDASQAKKDDTSKSDARKHVHSRDR